MAKIGYARVSSKDQNLDRQILELEKNGCSKIFKEKQSGKNIKDRKKLNEMFEYMREDDEIVVISLDRLSRNNNDIDKIINIIQEKGATFTILDFPSFQGVEEENLRKMLNNLVLEVFKYTAQNEREKIRERQRQGIEVAKKNGNYKNRFKYRADTSIAKDRLIYEQVILMMNDKKSKSEIAKTLGISRTTIYEIEKREKEKPTN